MRILARVRQKTWILGAFAIAAVTVFGLFHSGGAKHREIDPARKLQDDLQRERAISLVKWRYKEVCPSGHKTEIVIGQTHLHVDMRTIGLLEIEDSQTVPDGCPTEAVRAKRISFDLESEEVYAAYLRHGLRLDQLIIEVAGPKWYVGPTEVAENPSKRWVVDSVGMVDDVTDAYPNPMNVLNKSYRLQHIGDAADSSSPYVFMTCSGDPTLKGSLGRHCQTYYRLNEELRVHYRFRQDKQFDHPASIWPLPPTGPIKEPEGFLIMDAGVRARIREMQQANSQQ
jgi:hypothetical protein